MVQRKIKTHIQGIHPTGEVLVNVTSLTTETTTEHTVPLNKEHDANLILDLPYSQYHVEAEYTGDEGNQPVSHETVLDFRKQPRIESENDFWIWMAKWGIVPSVLQIQYNIYDENNNIITPSSIFDSLVEIYPSDQPDKALPQGTLFLNNLQCFITYVPLFVGESYKIVFKGDDAHNSCEYEFTVPVEMFHDHSQDKYRSLYWNRNNGTRYNWQYFGMVSMIVSPNSAGRIRCNWFNRDGGDIANLNVLLIKSDKFGMMDKLQYQTTTVNLHHLFIDSRNITGYYPDWLHNIIIRNNELWVYGLASDIVLYHGVSESELKFLVDSRLDTGAWYTVDVAGSTVSSEFIEYAESHRITLTNYNDLRVSTELSINVPLVIVYSDEFNINGVLTDEEENSMSGETVNLLVGDTIVDTTTTDNNGEYSFTRTPVHTGTHTFKVQYDGDEEYAPCSSSTVTRDVSKETSVLNLTQPLNNASVTDTLIVEGTLFTDDGEVIPSSTIEIRRVHTLIGTLTVDNNGEFTGSIDVSGWTPGTHALIFAYPGDSNYVGSSTVREINVGGHIYDFDVTATTDTVAVNGSVNNSTLTGVLTDNNTPVAGETVIITVKDENDTTIVSTTGTTDSDGEVSYTYTAAARGDVSIIMECRNLQETYVIEDVSYYFPDTYNNGVVQLCSHISTNFKAEYKIRITQTSYHGHYFQVGDASGAMLIGTTAPTSSKSSIFAWNISGGNTNIPGSLQLDTWYTVEVSYIDGVWTVTIDGESATLQQQYTNRNYIGVRPETYGYVKEIKITELSSNS